MKTLSNNFRIRIDMSNVAINPTSSRVWLLVNPDDCSNVKLLKKKIADKFSLLYSSKQFDVVLQDFIIPDDELIEIIKCDDIISLRRKLGLAKSKPGSFIDNESDGQEKEVALSQEVNHSEKRKKKNAIKLKPVEKIRHSEAVKIHTKKRMPKRKRLLIDEECQKPVLNNLEVTEDVLIDAQDSENNEAEKSVNEIPQVSEVDYEAMFPLPKKRRRRHRKISPVKTHTNDDVIQNVVEKPFGSFPLKLRDYDDTEHVRRHLRFADDENEKVDARNESSKIESIINNSENGLTKETFSVEQTLPEQIVENQPIDLSKFERLLGPPRTNDHICYQVLELSEDYSPQISSLRVGKVKSIDPHLNITVELDKPIATKPRKGKFELIDKIEDENYNEEELEEEEEETILIENESYNLNEMIDLKVRV